MPTNLPPDYYEIEKRYRAASDPAEKAALLEEMYAVVPKHKGTDHLRADLRRQLAHLREEAQKSKGKGGHASVYHVEREGAGQAVLVGPANVGKSALLRALTHAVPEVSPVPYTTWRPLPGMMAYQNIQIQLVDTPPLDRQVGVEPAMLDLVRRTDLVLPVVDLTTEPLEQLEDTLDILQSGRVLPAHTQNQPTEEKRPVYLPMLVLANKYDDPGLDDLLALLGELLGPHWPLLGVSAQTGAGLEALRCWAFSHLGVVRVYTRAPGKEPDYSKPFILKQGGTVEDLAGRIHKDFLNHLKFARLWGSGEFPGQMVQHDYVLHDGDVVELKI